MSDAMTMIIMASFEPRRPRHRHLRGPSGLAGLARGETAGARRQRPAASARSPAGDMIEVADLKERVRKLESIAACIDL